jgi:hypothetical protein
MRILTVTVVTAGVLWTNGLRAETALLEPTTPWRAFVVSADKAGSAKDGPNLTALPPADWTQAEFDDGSWGRCPQSDLLTFLDKTDRHTLQRLCLRTRFGIADPAQAKDVVFKLQHDGKSSIYVNGNKITDSWAGGTIGLPSATLRKGTNILVVDISVTNKVSLGAIGLTSGSGAGVVAYAAAAEGARVWSATPLDVVASSPGELQAGFLIYDLSPTPSGMTRGNPFDPLRPIRMIAPRGGCCSGQAVVSADAPFKGLRASLTPLKHVGGDALLPATAVRLAYAMQQPTDKFCNALMPAPVDGVPVQPVWVLVDVPRDQKPGWYTGALTVSGAGQTAAVPVQVFVAGWTLTDPKSNATFVCVYQSPDTLADHYKATPWSDRHFALIERSLSEMAPLGNDVLFVPVILDNYLTHKTGLIRWTKDGGGYKPEFSAFERYLDLQTITCGKPKVVTLSIWKHDFGCRSWFRGCKKDTVGPCQVTEFNLRTGAMQPMQAPHFGEPGSEEFWKTMIEGVRKIIKARGIDDKYLLLGEAFDSRPLEAHRLFFEKIEPEMRWQVYSHFDSGDQATVKDGKLVANGGFEIGFRIRPNEGALPELKRNYPNVPACEFYLAQAHRCDYQPASGPISYRDLLADSGVMARVGLDFWPIPNMNRFVSYYKLPEGWLARSLVRQLTAPGPDGAVRTVQGQMLLESVQETEAILSLIRGQQKAPPEQAARIATWLERRRQAKTAGLKMPFAMASQDLDGLSARLYALAAELAKETGEGGWAAPPVVKAE